MKVIEYQIAVGNGDCKELVQDVNDLIKNGFQPLGGVSSCVDEERVYYSQAMIKIASDET